MKIILCAFVSQLIQHSCSSQKPHFQRWTLFEKDSPPSFVIVFNRAMLESHQSHERYSLLSAADADSEKGLLISHPKRKSLHYILLVCLTISCLILSFGSGVLFRTHQVWASQDDPSTTSSCTIPITRREWRSLSRGEKSEYIQAVQCLTKTPSLLGMNHSLHDDFPRIHSHIGEYCMSFSSNKSHRLILNGTPQKPMKQLHSSLGRGTFYIPMSER